MKGRENKEKHIGPYRIIKLIGKGGFANVYLGEHVYLKRLTAIKVLSVGPGLSSSDLEKFVSEARHITKLEHPNIIQVFDFGVDPHNEPYLAMGYAPNGSLHARHPLGDTLAPATIITYVRQITDALQFTHDNGVVHCDVKPANMLLDRNNRVLLSDFGIAVVLQNSFKTGEPIGTPAYMSPEQLEGKPEFASDQYSLGVVVYSWLSGHLPYQNRNLSNLLYPLRHFVLDAPLRVEQVIARALAVRPRDRFAQIKDFANALEEAIQGNIPTILPTSDSPSHVPTWPAADPQGPNPSLKPVPPIQEDAAPSLPRPFRRSEEIPDKVNVRANTPLVSLPSSVPPSPVPRPSPSPPPEPPPKPSPQAPISPQGGPPWVPRSLPLVLTSATPDSLTYREHTAWVSTLAWSPSGVYIASGSWDSTVQVWNANTGSTVFLYPGHEQTVKGISWSPDGKYIASGSWDTTVRVWHALTRTAVASYKHKLQVEAVAWSPDGRYVASAGHDGSIHIWQANNGQAVFVYQGHTEPVWSLSWSPNERHIASASHDGSVRVWDVVAGSTVFTYQDYEKRQMAAVAWSPDGQYIAAASYDGLVRVWRAMQNDQVLRYQDSAGAAKALSWSPDGRRIASAVKQVQVWNLDAPNTRPAFLYSGHSSWVNALVWSPDGLRIASGGDDKTVQVWHVG